MERDYSLDALKMILIILVIYARIPLLDGLLPVYAHVELDMVAMHSVKGIYAFHMPLFVLLSGYFTKRKSLHGQLAGSIKLIKLFLIFHIVDLGIISIVKGTFPTAHDLIKPSFALWYLLCLFYWRMSVAILPQKISRKIAVLFSLMLSLLAGFVPVGGELGFQRFFSFLPYFSIGYFYGKDIVERASIVAHRFTPPQSACC